MTQTQGTRRGPKPNPHTRQDLLRAGVDMFHSGGFNATGIKDIVAEAGVPKGSFYNHFASKEAFGAEVADTYFDSNLTSMRALLQDSQVAPLERLRRYFEDRSARARETNFARGCLLGNLTAETADHSDLIRERTATHFATWSSLFRDCIDQAKSDGAITTSVPTETLAQFLLNSWEGALLRARSEKSAQPLRDFVDTVFGVVLK